MYLATWICLTAHWQPIRFFSIFNPIVFMLSKIYYHVFMLTEKKMKGKYGEEMWF